MVMIPHYPAASRRRRVQVVVAAATALIATACSSSGSGSTSAPRQSDRPPTQAPSQAHTLPAGVLSSIRVHVGAAPGAGVAGAGSVWVESHRENTLYRINPKSDRISARIDLGQLSCGVPVFAAGRVFVSPCEGSTKTLVVSAKTNQVVGAIPGTAPGGNLWYAFGSIWVSLPDFKHIARVDPVSLKRTATLHLPGVDFVNDRHWLWVAETDVAANYTGRVDKVDPTTDQVVARFRTTTHGLGADPWLAVAAGALWLKDSENPTLMSISTSTGKTALHRLNGWRGLDQAYDEPISVAKGSLWIRIANGKVLRFDPRTGRELKIYPADPAAGGGVPLVAFGSLWVPNFGTDSVWRVRIQ